MKRSLLKKIFSESKEKNSFISVYTNKENTEIFSIGIVCDFDDDFILLKKVNLEGSFDGFSILLIEDVYLIEWNDAYLKKMQLIIKNDIVGIEKEVQKLLLANLRFDDFIKLCLIKNFFISINSIYDIGFMGYVKNYDGENIVLNNIDSYNKNDGFSLFKISEIEKISLMSVELNTINDLN